MTLEEVNDNSNCVYLLCHDDVPKSDEEIKSRIRMRVATNALEMKERLKSYNQLHGTSIT